jgi:hypothetical protein
MGTRSSSLLTALQHAAAESRTVAQTCRYFGISRKTFYKWKGRCSRHGETGPSDQSRPAHRSPKATPSEVVNKILYLRQQYRCGAGPIADWSRRQRWQPYEKPQPRTSLTGRREVSRADSGQSEAALLVHGDRRLHAHPRPRRSDRQRREFQSRFQWHLETRDVHHVYIRSRTPHLNGKVERSHRVDAQEPTSEKFS